MPIACPHPTNRSPRTRRSGNERSRYIQINMAFPQVAEEFGVTRPTIYRHLTKV
ncbi:putative DNA-binding transcriptional regulator AlpA [Streptosporangium album]|uniref:Putative DNA-binding transcriptional regulator AlpA n=1 Tax=Streptosporangium album TaxID=47479 RepID=A0A7W7RTK1_9ACTN|nr:hypothetical protein [Streptosporangium album]MBB4937892.1 putative DNA-binding transcriptional regulator AlpA [Streptosporangium album]